MKTFLKRCWTWLNTSNRILHLSFGILFGVFATSFYCALYGGVGVASALEFKDRAHGGVWDWTDWIMTVVGFIFIPTIRLFF